MPGIGAKHVGIETVGGVHEVAEQNLLRHQREQGGPERHQVRCSQCFGVQNPQHRAHGDADAHGKQHDPQQQGGGRLDTFVAIGVFGVGGFFGVEQGEQHHEVANDVGQGVNTVRHQRLGIAQNPDDELHHGQHQVDEDADPSHAPADGIALGIAGVERVGMWMVAHGLFSCSVHAQGDAHIFVRLRGVQHLMPIHAAPRRNVVQGAGIGADHFERVARRQIFCAVLGANHR